MTTTIPAPPTTSPDARHEARRPDLTLLERVRLVERLLLEAPSLPTPLAKRLRLISIEALLRYCTLELALVLGNDDDVVSGWTVTP